MSAASAFQASKRGSLTSPRLSFLEPCANSLQGATDCAGRASMRQSNLCDCPSWVVHYHISPSQLLAIFLLKSQHIRIHKEGISHSQIEFILETSPQQVTLLQRWHESPGPDQEIVALAAGQASRVCEAAAGSMPPAAARASLRVWRACCSPPLADAVKKTRVANGHA